MEELWTFFGRESKLPVKMLRSESSLSRKGTDVIFLNESKSEQAAPFPGSGSVYSNERHLEMSPKQVLFQTQLFRVHRIISSSIPSSFTILSLDDIQIICYLVFSPCQTGFCTFLAFTLLHFALFLLCKWSLQHRDLWLMLQGRSFSKVARIIMILIRVCSVGGWVGAWKKQCYLEYFQKH